MTRFSPLALLLLVSVPGQAQPPEDPIRRLVDRKDAPSFQCCAGGDKSRCLEMLLRDDSPDQAEAACATLLATGHLPGAGGSSDCPSAHGPTKRMTDFGIETKNYSKNGWQQEGAADWYYGPASYPRETVAMGSAACAEPMKIGSDKVAADWRKKRDQCKSYETVHLHVILLDPKDTVTEYAESAAKDDGWMKDAYTRNRTYMLKARSFEAVQRGVAGLLEQCKIIQYANITAHGSPGAVYTQQKDGAGAFVTQFLHEMIPPCALAPSAQIQFAGCNLACGKTAEALRIGLQKMYSSPQYVPPGNPRPFENSKFLFNTATGEAYEPGWGERFFLGRHAGIRSTNDLAVVYTMKGAEAKSDIPTNKIAACTEAEEPKPWALEALMTAGGIF